MSSDSREQWLADVPAQPCALTGEGDTGVCNRPQRHIDFAQTNHQHPDNHTDFWPSQGKP